MAVLASACGDPLAGTWRQPDATTTLPDGSTLDVDATLVLDGAASPPAFDLHLDLSTMGLSDVIDARGTYEDGGENIALTFTGFTVDSASGNTTRVSDQGAQCITLQGFGGPEVCFPVPQTNAYVLEGDTLSMTIEQAIIVPEVTETHLALRRVP